MLKIMFKPFLKKYLGLFISMVFVSMLSIALLSAFVSTIINLENTFKDYLYQYEDVDAVFKIGFTQKEEIDDILTVDGVETVDYRLTMDTFLQKSDGRTITTRIFTYSEKDDNLVDRYILESVDKSVKMPNISVINKFANNNNFKAGDVIKVGYFNVYIDLYINEIIETPEAIQPRASDFVWSDTTDFGYIYVSITELDKILEEISVSLHKELNTNEKTKESYQRFMEAIGSSLPDLANEYVIGKDYASKYTNQLLIKAKEGYTEEQVVENITKYLEGKEITIESASKASELVYIIYIENCIRQLRIASIFLPLFFYFVTMIVIGLFINQIIKAQTQDIGVMMSIGVGKKDIISIFLLYTLLMSIVSGIIGVLAGLGLDNMLIDVMRRIYSMPTLPKELNPGLAVIAVLSLMIFAEVTTLISCSRIFKITPKDATISNEAKRRNLPKWLNRTIEKSPMTIKLGVNSIAQNPRRFFVSFFSIFASFVIILLAMFFYVAKTELMEQSVNRRLNYDCQVYFLQVQDSETSEEILSKDYVKSLEDCYYTYIEIKDQGSRMFLECLAFDNNTKNDLVRIPDASGKGYTHIEEEGIVIPLSFANKMKVGVGDKVVLNGVEVTITDVSNQYFHPIAFLSKTQLERIGSKYITSYLVDITDETAFLQYMGENQTGSLTVFTSSLGKDLSSVFDSVNIFIFILIGFSLGMSFIILVIMSQNALMEQKRQVSVLRAIGFTIKNISDYWTLQSVSQLLLSTIFAIPAGALLSMLLFSLCSSTNQTYPFVFDFNVVIIAFVFILAIIVATHWLAMIKIRGWNLADNTRSRE